MHSISSLACGTVWIVCVLLIGDASAQTATTGIDINVVLDNHNVPGAILTPSLDARHGPQSETSVAISPIDPRVVAVVSNDYRYLEVPLLPKCGLFWPALDVSIDDGATWHNTLVPGFHGDTSAAGFASPLHHLGPDAQGADPVVRFDAAGDLYLMGVAFYCNPGGPQLPGALADGASVVYVAKYVYTPGSPAGASTPTSAGDPPSFTYLSTRLVAVAPVGNGVSPGNDPTFRVVFLDKPWMATDNSLSSPYLGSLYAAWTPFPAKGYGTPVVFSRSTDGGATFSQPRQISQGGALSEGVGFGPFISVASNGCLLVLYPQVSTNPPSNGMMRIKVFRSTDGGDHFSNGVNAASFVQMPFDAPGLPLRTPTLPQMAFDDTNSSIAYIAYAAMNGSPANADIFVVRSTDGGVSWGTPVKVNDDATSKHQFFPTLSVSHGVLHLAWNDLRASSNPGDPATSDALDVYYAYSNFGGISYPSFSPNVRVTDVSSSTHCEIETFDGTMGDYIEIASRYDASTGKHFAHVAWADARNIPSSLCAGPVVDPVNGAINDAGAANIDVYTDVITLTPAP